MWPHLFCTKFKSFTNFPTKTAEASVLPVLFNSCLKYLVSSLWLLLCHIFGWEMTKDMFLWRKCWWPSTIFLWGSHSYDYIYPNCENGGYMSSSMQTLTTVILYVSKLLLKLSFKRSRFHSATLALQYLMTLLKLIKSKVICGRAGEFSWQTSLL